jgi:hypothetical protein
MSLCQIIVFLMSVGQMSVGHISVGQMSVGQMSVGQMSFSQMTVRKNVFWPKAKESLWQNNLDNA